MARPRTTYTAEFKLAAVNMITEQKLSVAEVARRLDVSETLLRDWRKAVLTRGDTAFPGHGNLTPAEDELRRLRAEVQRLKAERDLLKKPPPTSPTRRVNLRLHRRSRRAVAGDLDVPSPGGVCLRLLRLGRSFR
jgi:transposase